MNAPAIDARGLTKRYGAITALDDFSLRVEEGEIFGFLGPNGAGKTTTIRVLLGLLVPASGAASVFGRPVTVDQSAWRADIGYLPGELSLWPGLSGARTLDLLQRLTGRPAVWRAELTERLQLSTADLARRVGEYSDGMKQKLGIVQALQCAPRLALLDEPTKGLDPLVQQTFYEIIACLPVRGTTVFFSSHVLPEVERACARVAMLRAGRLVFTGTVDQLRGTMPRRVTVVFRDDVDADTLGGVGRVVERQPRRLSLEVSVEAMPDLVARLAHLPLLDLVVEPPSLEDAFLDRYR